MADIRLIRYFITVIEERNITRAAEKLGIQQPPLSVQLKKLEARVGAKLLKRVPTGIEPTPAGMALYSDYHHVLEKLAIAEQNARRIDRGLSGELILGVTHSTITHPLIKKSLQIFLKHHEDVTLRIVTAGSREIYADISENKIDLGFVRPLTWSVSPIQEDLITTDPMIVALPHTEFHERIWFSQGMRLQDIMRFKLILYRTSNDPILFNTTIAAFENQGLNLNNIQLCPSVNISLDLVSTGLGATIVPASLKTHTIPNVSFFEISAGEHPPSEIMLVKRRNVSNILAQKFRKTVLETLNNT